MAIIKIPITMNDSAGDVNCINIPPSIPDINVAARDSVLSNY